MYQDVLIMESTKINWSVLGLEDISIVITIFYVYKYAKHCCKYFLNVFGYVKIKKISHISWFDYSTSNL